ncbi:hypothetical protein O181_083765 [Austropuccinia psidii MF-1]|uniref:Reverse transcriptase/retrotransposon-derived protein RNase H-like domain-containing protein n=1 Tax=Austropuccinia psidii MF-1 TaxID=1389203 RepID=A0A9Q3FNU1_9BASI|nr:hypothetical protein [Austropuccinia psidii MF-1]
MFFLLKASRWTKKNCSRFSTGLLQETSRLFNHSLALPISTAVSSRIIQRRSVNSPVSSRKITVSPSMRKLLVIFTTATILSRFNPSLPTIVETDASDYALGALLSQVSDSGKQPIAFNSSKLIPAELKYEIHYKELLGIVWALKRWRAFLLSLLPLLKFSAITVPFNTSCLQKFLLTFKPSGLNFFLNFIFQSLTALEA